MVSRASEWVRRGSETIFWAYAMTAGSTACITAHPVLLHHAAVPLNKLCAACTGAGR